MEVLVLLFEGKNQSLETGVYFAIDAESVLTDNPIDELPISRIIFRVISLTKIVDPVILRVVLDIRVNSVDLFDD